MRTVLLPLALLGLLSLSAQGAVAHHVEGVDDTPPSPFAAYFQYQKQYVTQVAAINMALAKHFNAPSASERSDAMLEVETGFNVTIEHLASLPRHECFEDVHEAAIAEIEAAAADWAQFKLTGEPNDWPRARAARVVLVGLINEDPRRCLDESLVYHDE